MIKLDSLSNDELVAQTQLTIREERSKTTDVIRLFEEISVRKLFLTYGYSSLYEMATIHFGYCAGSAMRRINAMKLIREIPEVEAKIASGDLSLSVVSEVQSFFYQEAKNDRPYSISAKVELLDKSVGMSKREVERELASRNPERDKRETIYAVSNERLRVSFSISHELNVKLNHLKDLLGHIDPDMTTESLLERLAELGLEKFDPARKAARAKARREKSDHARTTDSTEKFDSPPPAEVEKRTRYIPAEERHNVAPTKCSFVSPATGRTCNSTRFLQLDHIQPFAQAGENTAQNLRWMCGAHNRARAMFL